MTIDTTALRAVIAATFADGQPDDAITPTRDALVQTTEADLLDALQVQITAAAAQVVTQQPPIPNTLALFGDSYVDRTTLGGAGTQYNELGLFVPANVMLGWPFQIVKISGHGGYTTSDLLGLTQHNADTQQNYLATDILSLLPLPKYCLISCGTNDAVSFLPLATTIANLKTILTALMAAGITPILMSLPPRNSLSNAQLLQTTQMLRWQREYALQNSIIFVDMFHALAHPDTGSFLAAGQYGALVDTSADGVHPSPYGASLIGEAIDTALGAAFPTGSGAVSGVVVGAGTSGFVVGDLLTTIGEGTPALFQVATLSGSQVATVTAISGGALSSVPQNPVSMTTSTGVGVGTVTLTVTWQNVRLGHPQSLPSWLPNRMGRLSLGGDATNIDIAYDAARAPPPGNVYGNFIKNGMLLGVGGTNSFGSGQVATSWTVTQSTVPAGGGGTVLWAKVPRNTQKSRGFWQQCSMFGGTAGGSVDIQSAQDVSSANSQAVWAVGDLIYAECEFELDALNYGGSAGTIPCSPPILQITFLNVSVLVSTANCFLGQTATNLYRMPSGILRTPNVAIPATTTRFFAHLIFQGNGTVRFSEVEIRKVITP